MQFLTPQIFDAMIVGVILIGLALAVVRLYQDLVRSRPANGTRPEWADEDTQPNETVNEKAS